MAVVASVSALAVVSPPDARYSEESMASLRLCWRPSSSLATALEFAIKLEGSATCLFSELSSSVERLLLSPTIGLSLNLDGPTLDCCYRRTGEVEDVGLDGPA